MTTISSFSTHEFVSFAIIHRAVARHMCTVMFLLHLYVFFIKTHTKRDTRTLGEHKNKTKRDHSAYLTMLCVCSLFRSAVFPRTHAYFRCFDGRWPPFGHSLSLSLCEIGNNTTCAFCLQIHLMKRSIELASVRECGRWSPLCTRAKARARAIIQYFFIFIFIIPLIFFPLFFLTVSIGWFFGYKQCIDV